jgi:peptidoglycan hydrolase-like protein with peptidoglycan-binding domain
MGAGLQPAERPAGEGIFEGVRTRAIVGCLLGGLALAPGAAAGALADGGARVGSARATGVPTGTTGSTGPTTTTSLTALPRGTVSDGTAAVVVRLSGAVGPKSPTPLLSPAVAGRWTTSGNLETFTPTSTLAPCTTYQLTIWAQTAAAGQLPLGIRRVVRFSVACPGVRAVQEALGRLHYLPYRFHPRSGKASQAGSTSRGAAARAAFKPAAGRFVKVIRDAPPLSPGRPDATTRGALEVFQGTHGSAPTGTADAATWAALLGAEAGNHTDRRPYTFVTVSKAMPESLEVHRDNRIALKAATNTGVAGAITQNGVFPIFARFVSTTMTGTNPDGTHYVDPGVPWVNYFNGGDAVHGFNRPSYGSPQSNGCVELPPSTAAVVFRMLKVGDLVVVHG